MVRALANTGWPPATTSLQSCLSRVPTTVARSRPTFLPSTTCGFFRDRVSPSPSSELVSTSTAGHGEQGVASNAAEPSHHQPLECPAGQQQHEDHSASVGNDLLGLAAHRGPKAQYPESTLVSSTRQLHHPVPRNSHQDGSKKTGSRRRHVAAAPKQQQQQQQRHIDHNVEMRALDLHPHLLAEALTRDASVPLDLDLLSPSADSSAEAAAADPTLSATVNSQQQQQRRRRGGAARSTASPLLLPGGLEVEARGGPGAGDGFTVSLHQGELAYPPGELAYDDVAGAQLYNRENLVPGIDDAAASSDDGVDSSGEEAQAQLEAATHLAQKGATADELREVALGVAPELQDVYGAFGQPEDPAGIGAALEGDTMEALVEGGDAPPGPYALGVEGFHTAAQEAEILAKARAQAKPPTTAATEAPHNNMPAGAAHVDVGSRGLPASEPSRPPAGKHKGSPDAFVVPAPSGASSFAASIGALAEQHAAERQATSPAAAAAPLPAERAPAAAPEAALSHVRLPNQPPVYGNSPDVTEDELAAGARSRAAASNSSGRAHGGQHSQGSHHAASGHMHQHGAHAGVPSGAARYTTSPDIADEDLERPAAAAPPPAGSSAAAALLQQHRAAQYELALQQHHHQKLAELQHHHGARPPPPPAGHQPPVMQPRPQRQPRPLGLGALQAAQEMPAGGSGRRRLKSLDKVNRDFVDLATVDGVESDEEEWTALAKHVIAAAPKRSIVYAGGVLPGLAAPPPAGGADGEVARLHIVASALGARSAREAPDASGAGGAGGRRFGVRRGGTQRLRLALRLLQVGPEASQPIAGAYVRARDASRASADAAAAPVAPPAPVTFPGSVADLEASRRSSMRRDEDGQFDGEDGLSAGLILGQSEVDPGTITADPSFRPSGRRGLGSGAESARSGGSYVRSRDAMASYEEVMDQVCASGHVEDGVDCSAPWDNDYY